MTTTATSAPGSLSDGLWWNTSGLANLLGLGPLLAASRSFEGGLVLGLASLAVLCTSNLLIAVLGRGLAPRWRLPACALLIGALVTAVDLLIRAGSFELYGEVGLFVPLIVTNSLVLAQAETAAAGRHIGRALLDGLAHGLGFTVLLTGIGLLRELLAPGLLVAGLPAGVFFLVAAVIALRQLRFLRRGDA